MNKIINNWKAKKIDIEAAFLDSKLDEEIYVDLPEGLENIETTSADEVGKLNAALYGLVQASRIFYKTMRTYLVKHLGFTECKSEPCILKHHNIIIRLYVDDILIIGEETTIETFTTQIEKRFNIRKSDIIDEFIGCEMKWSKDHSNVILHQTNIVNKLFNILKKDIQDMREYKTPGIPVIGIDRPKIDDPCMSSEKQSKFRSAIGTMLYLTKHSRPDINNSVRELSKVLDSGTDAHYKQMLRVGKFIQTTKNIGLKIQPNIDKNTPWKMNTYVDSDWGGDKNNRKSVSGWTIFVNECLIGWGSRGQKMVTLSSTEAEYVGVSEICKEIL